jgi:hypothetical protein
MRLRLLALALGMVVIASPLGARVKVQSAGDPNFDFTPLKTYHWPADGFGQFKMALTKDDDPEAMRKRYEPWIVTAVENSLTGRGFVKASEGQPADFDIAYFALISSSTSAQVTGQFLGGDTAWGLPPFLATTKSLKIFEQGSIVLDVRRPGGNAVWRGTAQAELHRERPEVERKKRLQSVVDDILKQFPPKKKKS